MRKREREKERAEEVRKGGIKGWRPQWAELFHASPNYIFIRTVSPSFSPPPLRPFFPELNPPPSPLSVNDCYPFLPFLRPRPRLLFSFHTPDDPSTLSRLSALEKRFNTFSPLVAAREEREKKEARGKTREISPLQVAASKRVNFRDARTSPALRAH